MASKATGWKIPLIFCAAIIIAAGAIHLCLPEKKPAPLPVPDSLLAKAKALHIDLAGDWKDRIINAGSGFVPSETRDYKLGLVAREAIAGKRLDAACAAGAMIRGAKGKQAVLELIFDHASKDCASAPWAVFALRGMPDEARMKELADDISKKWAECEKGG